MDQPTFIPSDTTNNSIEIGKKPFIAPKMEKVDITLTQNTNNYENSGDGTGLYVS